MAESGNMGFQVAHGVLTCVEEDDLELGWEVEGHFSLPLCRWIDDYLDQISSRCALNSLGLMGEAMQGSTSPCLSGS